MGVKPLYYAETPEAFVFGSEIKSIFESGQVAPRCREEAVAEYLLFRQVAGPVGLFEGIKALPDDLRGRHPAGDWRGFACFRDVLAHQYFRIERTFLWKAISASLPPLDAAVAAELKGSDYARRE